VVVSGDFVFDSGALGQLAASDVGLAALVERVLEAQGRVVVPSVVLAKCCGETRYDAGYHRALKALGGTPDCVVSIDRRLAVRAGGILRLSRMSETIDGIVVAVAESLGPSTSVVTADTGHMIRLASAASVHIGIIDSARC
jgi:hypothetical protein